MNERTILYYCRNPYSLRYVADFDPVLLRLCPVDQARGKDKKRLNELFIMFDTETSKSFPDQKKIVGGSETYAENPNYIVSWSCAISILGHPQVTIWGDRPEQIAPTLSMIHEALRETGPSYTFITLPMTGSLFESSFSKPGANLSPS